MKCFLLCRLAGNALCAAASLKLSKPSAGTMSTSPSVAPVKGETFNAPVLSVCKVGPYYTRLLVERLEPLIEYE